MRKGLFISVDGPNGAGKTTFIRTLVENLSVNYDVYDTREPSPTSFGTFVKKNEGGLKGMQYAQLIWADRHYHLQTCVQPQLSLGKIVVCDRYIDSSFVLQGFDGVSEEQIWELNKSFLRPDLNIILLADPEILQKRLQKRESLSAFEKRMTREEEIYMYRKAIDFLSRKNIPHIIYMNNTYDYFLLGTL
jgi:dTMP kinase